MSKILLLHTGGTIGMASGPEGLAPARGLVETAIATLAPKGADIVVEAFDPLLDSADIGPQHWNRIVTRIAGFRGKGVVVTHGTDTMTFTGAALAQALQGIHLPVVLCGAMQPLCGGGDAEGNLSLALWHAMQGAPGVWLAFAGQVLPAAGLVKHDTQVAHSFRSVPQTLPQGPFRPRLFRPLRLAILTLSPGLPVAALAAALAELDGAVLRVFGAGTVMADPALHRLLAAATSRACRLRAVSQCETGGLVPGAYGAGAPLWRAGVENGGTETPEAALARLWIEMSERGD